MVSWEHSEPHILRCHLVVADLRLRLVICRLGGRRVVGRRCRGGRSISRKTQDYIGCQSTCQENSVTSLYGVLSCFFFLDSPFSRGTVDIVFVVTGAKVLIEQGSIPLKLVK